MNVNYSKKIGASLRQHYIHSVYLTGGSLLFIDHVGGTMSTAEHHTASIDADMINVIRRGMQAYKHSFSS